MFCAQPCWCTNHGCILFPNAAMFCRSQIQVVGVPGQYYLLTSLLHEEINYSSFISLHQHFGKIDSGFSLVFTGFQVSGNSETQEPRNRQHTLSKYLLKFKYYNYIVSISMNSIISFLGFLGFHTSSLWVGFQKTRHRFSGFQVSWFSLVFARFPWLLNVRNLWKLISLNTDVPSLFLF